METKRELVILVGKTVESNNQFYVNTTKSYGEIPVVHDKMGVRDLRIFNYYRVYTNVTVYNISPLMLMVDDEPDVVMNIINGLYEQYKKINPNAEFYTVNIDFNIDFVQEYYTLSKGKSSIKDIIQKIINKKLVAEIKDGLRISSKPCRETANQTFYYMPSESVIQPI